MLLIATPNMALAKFWTDGLSSEFSIYDPYVKKYDSLEIILKKTQIEILLLDQDILLSKNVNPISDLVVHQKNLNIILFVDHYDAQEELSSIIFGAKAYCFKNASIDMLKKIIQKIMEGELWVDRKFTSRLLSSLADLTQAKHKEAVHLDSGYDLLTPREKEIAHWVSTGYPNRKIAQTLNISERTVKAHLGLIFRKLNINDRLQLALYITKYHQLARVWSPKPIG